jgi:HemY protein
MKRILFFLMIFILALVVGVMMAHDPGYALFAYSHWTIQMPLWVAGGGLILMVVIFYNILLFLKGTGALPKRIKLWRKQHKQQKSLRLTHEGLLALAEGKWREAEQLLIKGIQYHYTPLINYLAAAKAAQEQGVYDRRDEYLRLAHETTPDAEIAIGLTQAQLQYTHQQLEHSLATLRHLQHIAPKHAFVLKMLKQLYEALNDWQSLQEILPEIKKYKVLKNNEYHALELSVYYHLLLQATQSEDVSVLRHCWAQIPKPLQREKSLVIAYINALHQRQLDEVAETLLHDVIKHQWDKEYIHFYGYLKTTYPEKQLEFAESCLKQYGSSAALYLCLGRLALRNQLWGKARVYLQQCLDLEDNPDACAELGRLMESLGEQEAALRYYRQGLIQSVARTELLA